MKKILTAIAGILCVGMMVGCSPNTSGWESYQINGIIEYKAPPEWECQDSWYREHPCTTKWGQQHVDFLHRGRGRPAGSGSICR